MSYLFTARRMLRVIPSGSGFIGGIVFHATTGERLQNLFTSEKWKSHFSTLSDTLGFNLSIYSEAGKLIFSTESHAPLCRSLRASPSFKSQCEAYCGDLVMEALNSGTPKIFKCYAHIMSFAIPVEYRGEKAVILGQGSFPTYKDFLEFTNQLKFSEIKELPVTAPLTFTSAAHAQKALSLVEKSVNQLLQNTREIATLQERIDSLKDLMGRWSIAAREDPAAMYEYMLVKLLALLDIQHITIFSIDREKGVYISLFGLRRDGKTVESLTLGGQDEIVQELVRGRSFVSSQDPFLANRPEFAQSAKPFYFFPIVINKKLGGILGIFESELKETDFHIIAAFCRQIALSIENHFLHQDLSRKFDRFAAISELTRAISPIQSYETLLQAILDKSAELLKAEQGSLMLIDRETDALLLEAKKGVFDELTGEHVTIHKGEGIAGKVAALGEPFLVENVESDPRVQQKNRQRYKTPSFVSVPLKIEDRIIGVLNLADKTTGEVFNEEDLALIQSFATHAAIAIERNALHAQTEELKRLSITDPLTGLLNRRYMHDRLQEELARSERRRRHVSILMLDLDGFKYYNDTFGHLVGDKMLKTIAGAMVKSVRSMDIVSRYGGDEFVVILPETEASTAVYIAERIRSDVPRAALPTKGLNESATGFITISVGIACYPEHGATVELLLENADKALYLAKKKGKNRVEVFS